MWFGTHDGLNRYDGNDFRVYKYNPDDTFSIGNNVVTSIMQNDDGIIWMGTANGVYLYNPLYETFSRLDIKGPDGEVIEGAIRDMAKDKEGNIWLAAFKKGIYRISETNGLELFSLGKTTTQRTIGVRKIEFDNEGNLWLATYQQGLYSFNPEKREFKQYLIDKDSRNAADNDINALYLINGETLLVGTANKGVQSFSLTTCSFTPLLENDTHGKPLYIRCIIQSEKGELWIGTEKGVYIHNLQTKHSINLQHRYNDPYSISDNAIHSIYQDREGGIWVGTFFGGVNYFIESYARFEKHYPVSGENTISGKSISEFCEDEQQNIWIGTEDAGLNKFDPATRRFSGGFVPATNIHALLADNHNLWIGSFSEGLYVMDMSNHKFRSYKNSLDKNSLNSNNIYSIYKDGSGTIWIGTMMGLHTYNSDSDNFNRIQEHVINHQVNDILEDYKGLLWFATIGDGLFCYDRYNNEWKHYTSVAADDNVAGKMITCILENDRNQLWIGTEGTGLCMYDPQSDSFTNFFTTKDGLPNDVVYQLVEDIQGNIWGSTNKGLFRLDMENQTIAIYSHANGLLGDQFNYKSGFRSKEGKIYFGGIKGFVAFMPYHFWSNNVAPPIVINSFQVSNKEVTTGSDNSMLKYSITHTDEINIPYNVSTFSLGFAALSYVSPRGNMYAYQLKGKDKDWIYTDQLHKVTYSDLSPGNYVFMVKASNSDGLWNEEGSSLKINILPPFYRTLWAYMFYIILVFTLLFLLIRYYIERVNSQNKRAIEALEIRKEKELYNAKINFFTNITHEIRTPLSLIKSPLEEVLKYMDPKDKNWENLSIIQRNTNRLLKLVNELLDFRNAESEGLEFNFVRTDVVSVIKYTATRFAPSAELKGVLFEVNLPDTEFHADIDAEIFTKILSNLFNNALKHAESYIRIDFNSLNDDIMISVSNDGDKIPGEFSKKIFEPFFKLDESTQGSGLGLPFAKSLVELHKGSIFLDKENLEETMFVIRLPICQEKSIRFHEDTKVKEGGLGAENKETVNTINIEEAVRIDSGKTILLVEDNEDFLQFTLNQLKDEYHMLKASTGKQALEILNREFVDLIVTDIMMPVMDGLELCRKVKENLRYSHIPVILLTAKTALQSKIEGLKTGADEYIEKPYSVDFLKARIENLMENRRKIKNSYKHSPEIAYNTIAHSKADEDFLNNLIHIIHAHLDDVNLDVDKLADCMNISRATFYRKVKSISELTPNDFIRLIRLKKAAELLRQKEYRVNEVAFIVGFNSSSYFSKCFYKQFGVLPKDFEKDNK
jgi:signal transduction histidine kinase/ligand-binding sensor domain-containing protein/DNA-binding response OmpR family regulator